VLFLYEKHINIHIYICSYDDIDKSKVDFSLNDHELRSGL
jgi:hypothetical protein